MPSPSTAASYVPHASIDPQRSRSVIQTHQASRDGRLKCHSRQCMGLLSAPGRTRTATAVSDQSAAAFTAGGSVPPRPRAAA